MKMREIKNLIFFFLPFILIPETYVSRNKTLTILIPMSLSSLKLHNAMWPGLVGKGDDEGQEPPSASRICSTFQPPPRWTEENSTALILSFLPHTNPEASDDELKGIADLIQSKGFDIGSLVAPVWPGTVGIPPWVPTSNRKSF